MIKEKYLYSFSPETGYYQCDVNGNVRLSGILRLGERAAGEHLDTVGISYGDLYKKGQVFLLAKLGAKILRMPAWNDRLIVDTAPQPTKGAQFGREIIISNDKGERLVEIHTIWLLIDEKQRRILRPSEFDFAMPSQEGLIEPYAAQRIKATGEQIGTNQYTVRYSGMDINQHLNNTVYGDIVTDNIPFNELRTKGIESFNIHYQHEATHGDTIDIVTHQNGEREYYVTGTMNENECFVAKIVLNIV